MTLRHLQDRAIKDLAFVVAKEVHENENVRIHDILDDLEKEIILNTMVLVDDNQSSAARVLGMSRTALLYKLKEYGRLHPAEKNLDQEMLKGLKGLKGYNDGREL